MSIIIYVYKNLFWIFEFGFSSSFKKIISMEYDGSLATTFVYPPHVSACAQQTHHEKNGRQENHRILSDAQVNKYVQKD